MMPPTGGEPSEVVAICQQAEAMGYGCVWFADHLMPPYTNPEGPLLECWTWLTTIAAKTSRIRVGTMTLANGFRQPGVLAKMAASLDVISGGRLEIGMGAGWSEREHKAYGLPFLATPTRIAQMAEAIAVMKLLFTQREATFKGVYYAIEGAYCEPKPLQKPHPPIWVGGAGEKLTLRVVARHADGWNCPHLPLPELRHKLDVLAAHCRVAGRDPASIRKSLLTSVLIAENEATLAKAALALAERQNVAVEQLPERMLVGTPEQCARQLRSYVDLGITDFILPFRSLADARSMQLFIERVASAFA
ncbi:MAG: TIGR03560 family F420-dependent LLM class oxidoreductase [Chloroflexi bacterium]|nr:TIGR03560 family F420-dependent LLM class oxidoreductase [Chloroflexota bacterium]